MIDLKQYKEQWDLVKEFIKYIDKKEQQSTFIKKTEKILIGNKRDLIDEVKFQQIKKQLTGWVNAFNASGKEKINPEITYTSAKQNIKINDAFLTIIRKIR